MSQRARIILIVSILVVIIVGGGIAIFYFSSQAPTGVETAQDGSPSVLSSGQVSAGDINWLGKCTKDYDPRATFDYPLGTSFSVNYDCKILDSSAHTLKVSQYDLPAYVFVLPGEACRDESDQSKNDPWPPKPQDPANFTYDVIQNMIANRPIPHPPLGQDCSLIQGTNFTSVQAPTEPPYRTDKTIDIAANSSSVKFSTNHVFKECDYYQYDDVAVDGDSGVPSDLSSARLLLGAASRISGTQIQCGIQGPVQNFGSIHVRAWEETTGETPAAYSQAEGSASTTFQNQGISLKDGNGKIVDLSTCTNKGKTGGAGREFCDNNMAYGTYSVSFNGEDPTKYQGPITAENNSGATNPVTSIKIDAANPLAVIDFAYTKKGTPTAGKGNLTVRVFHDFNPADQQYTPAPSAEGKAFAGQKMQIISKATGQDIARTKSCINGNAAGGAGKNNCWQIPVGDYEVTITPKPENSGKWSGPITIPGNNPGQNPYTVTVKPGPAPTGQGSDIITFADFGYTLTGTPTGLACATGDVYSDLDGNSQRQVGIIGYTEPGFNGVKVTLKDLAGKTVATDTTKNQSQNIGGLYDLGCHNPGDYTVSLDESTSVTIDGTSNTRILNNLQKTGPDQTPKSIKLVTGQTTANSFGYKDNIIAQSIQCGLTANPTRGSRPLTVAFDGSTSTGSIVNYAWDFGDGNTTSTTTPTTSYTYQTARANNPYTATLTVSDAAKNSDSCSVPITVLQPPITGGGTNNLCTVDKTVVDETPNDEETPDDPKHTNSSPGETLTFTITWDCSSLSEANPVNGITITDTYDTALTTLVPGSITPPGVDSNPPGTIVWQITGPATSGGSVNFKTKINSNLAPGSYTSPNFVALVRNGQVDPDDTDTTKSDIDVPAGPDTPDLTVTKVSEDLNGGTLQVGDVLEYTIIVWNSGNVRLDPVTVTDNVPAFVTGFDPTQMTIPTGATNSSQAAPAGTNSTGLINVTGFALDPGNSAIIKFQVTVAVGTPSGTQINDLATATSGSTSDNDSDSVTVGSSVPGVIVTNVGNRTVVQRIVYSTAPPSEEFGVSPQIWLLILSLLAAALIGGTTYKIYKRKALS